MRPVSAERLETGPRDEADAEARPSLVVTGSEPESDDRLYRYTDRRGRVHVVDQLSAVPARYRDRVTVYE